MIPGLEIRLMKGSNEDVVYIAELVSCMFDSQQFYVSLESATDTEGLFQRQVRRHKEFERRHLGLDYASRPASEPTVGS
jgi:hypothetical protein